MLKILKAELSDPKMLKTCMDIISNMIDEANLVATEEGLHLRAMDPAHVALVELSLQKEVFDTYELEAEEVKLGLDLGRLSSVLKRAEAKDRLALLADERELKITFEGISTRTFRMPLIEVSGEDLALPNLDFPATAEIEPETFGEAVRDAMVVGDNVALRAEEERLCISAGGELGEVEIEIPRENTYYFKSAGEVESTFGLEYLKDMIKAKDMAKVLRISIGRDMPVKLEYQGDGVEMKFLLAPRVER